MRSGKRLPSIQERVRSIVLKGTSRLKAQPLPKRLFFRDMRLIEEAHLIDYDLFFKHFYS